MKLILIFSYIKYSIKQNIYIYIFNNKLSYSFVIKYKTYLNLSICIVPLGTKV